MSAGTATGSVSSGGSNLAASGSANAADSDLAASRDAGSAASGGSATTPLASPLPPGCREQEILERFARPASQGGCTDPEGLGCHESGTGEDPVLSQPGETLARLLDQQDSKGCGRVWIQSGAKKAEDAFLYRRLSQNVSEEDCEVQMPLMEEPLDSATLACIGAWLVWVANGRQP